MRKLRTTLALLLIMLLAIQIAPVQAQNLDFQVPSENIQAIVNSDGTLSLDYQIQFSNSNSGDVIDIVDVGMPNYDYVLSTMTADINGFTVTDIRDFRIRSPRGRSPPG